MQKISKPFDLLVLLLLPLAASFLSIFFHLNFVFSTLLMFGLPSLFLLLRHPLPLKKISLYSLLFSVPFTFIFDYFLEKDQGWFVVSTMFPFRLFGLVTLDIFVWGYVYIFFLVSYYECFLNQKVKQGPVLTRAMQYFSIFLASLVILVAYLAHRYSSILAINYAYLVLGLLVTTSMGVITWLWMPTLLTRFFHPTLYFTYLAILNEYTSLQLQHWTFPGTHFVGMTNFFGFHLPYEETVFYFILAAPIAFAFYEFFDDDRQ